MEIPVRNNEQYKIKIIDINHLGQGFGRIDNFAVFVNGAITNDEVLVRIKQVKKNYAVADIEDIIKPSKYRVKPLCDKANVCGGCQLQSMDYKAQLMLKTDRVKNDLKRIGGLEDVKVNDTLGMEQITRYRNKAQFPVSSINGKATIGFYKRGSHQIIDTDECIIQHEINDKVLEVFRCYMNKFKVKTYDHSSGKGVIRHILTKTSFKTGDLMIVIITKGEKLPHQKELIEMFKDIPNVKSIIQNINNKKNNVILGDKCITIYGEDKITDYIEDLKFKISPLSFFQVNPMQTKVLYQKALEYAELKGDEIVYDLYCGIGTISLFLAKQAKKVYGIEVVEEAIKDAKENARLNKIENTEFLAGTAEEVFPKLYNQGIKADVVVLDPPRKGCEQSVLDTIIKMQPQKVVYVSCNPATLARDLKYLSQKGYKVEQVQPVDLFGFTVHVETVVGLQRKESGK